MNVGLSVVQNSLARFGSSSLPTGETRQNERRPNIPLEPSRLGVLCDNVPARRAGSARNISLYVSGESLRDFLLVSHNAPQQISQPVSRQNHSSVSNTLPKYSLTFARAV